MIKLNINRLQKQLFKYLVLLKQGETILLCKRNIPVAEIHALPKPLVKPRPIGLAKGLFKVPAEFFDPLPDDILNGFLGKT